MSNPDTYPAKESAEGMKEFGKLATPNPYSFPPKYEITKEDILDIKDRMDRIEEGLRRISGLQLINGVWR
ncbi:MAG: hypothetical protein GY797_09345 [Deltaproteobacteria bacterium]|nr:hypothetical protein [Deltaproteobacteria bacterium]